MYIDIRDLNSIYLFKMSSIKTYIKIVYIYIANLKIMPLNKR